MKVKKLGSDELLKFRSTYTYNTFEHVWNIRLLVGSLVDTQQNEASQKLKIKRESNTLNIIRAEIVCGQLKIRRNETWEKMLNKRYDERSIEEGSNSPDSI